MIPHHVKYDPNASPPQFTDKEDYRVEPGTHVRVKIVGTRSEVTNMWAIGTVNEDFLGYLESTFPHIACRFGFLTWASIRFAVLFRKSCAFVMADPFGGPDTRQAGMQRCAAAGATGAPSCVFVRLVRPRSLRPHVWTCESMSMHLPWPPRLVSTNQSLRIGARRHLKLGGDWLPGGKCINGEVLSDGASARRGLCMVNCYVVNTTPRANLLMALCVYNRYVPTQETGGKAWCGAVY